MPDPLDGERYVDEVFHNDRPHDPDTTLAAADAIAELVRYLNYATRTSNRALPYASVGCQLVGRLEQAAARQPQLYEQLADWAAHLAADPALGHDHHPDRDDTRFAARAAIECVQGALTAAAMHASALAAALDNAQHFLTPLHHEAG